MVTSLHRCRYLTRMLAVLALLFTTITAAVITPTSTLATTADEAASSCPPIAIDEAEWEEYGLIGKRAYESPQFGTAVEWTRDWALDEEADYPIESDEDCQFDAVHIIWEDGDQYALLNVTIGTPSDVKGMDELTASWEDEDFLQNNWDTGYTGTVVVSADDETVAETLFSVIREKDDAQYYVIYRTVALSDDTWLYLTFTTDEASLEAGWTMLDEGVTVDGEPIPAALTWRKIERAL